MRTRPASCLWLKVCLAAACCIGLGKQSARSDSSAIQRTPVESSSIASIGHSRASKLLEIEFRSGAIYRYRKVPRSVFTAFSTARSKGNFFSGQVRGKYDFEKISGSKQ